MVSSFLRSPPDGVEVSVEVYLCFPSENAICGSQQCGCLYYKLLDVQETRCLNKTIPRFWTIEEQSKSIEFLVIKAYPFVK